MLNFEKKSGKPITEDVVDRLFILRTLIIYAYAYATLPFDIWDKTLAGASSQEREDFEKSLESLREKTIASLKDNKLWDKISVNEMVFLNTPVLSITQQQIINISWRMESVICLMWSLNLIKDIPPFDQPQSPDLLDKIPIDNLASFRKEAKLRPESEIIELQSIAELWHWRDRTRELQEKNIPITLPNGVKNLDELIRSVCKSILEHDRKFIPVIEEDFLAFNKPYRDLDANQYSEVRSISMERHFALNWLCGFSVKNDWDSTSRDT